MRAIALFPLTGGPSIFPTAAEGLGEVDLATGSGQETQREPATHGEGRRGELAAAHTIPEVDVTKRQRECRFIFDLQLLQIETNSLKLTPQQKGATGVLF